MHLTFAKTALLALVLTAPLAAPAAAAGPRPPKPDLADVAQGTYEGSVMSDSRGAGRPNVTITVTKTGPNTVQVSSDYPRLPTFTTKLAQYMSTIQKVGPGGEVFLLDLSKNPRTLGVTDDQASFGGVKAGG